MNRGMDHVELSEFARHLLARVDERPVTKRKPGTVAALNDDGSVSVLVDGDLESTLFEDLVGGLAVDDRVMVLYQPPGAVFVVSLIQ